MRLAMEILLIRHGHAVDEAPGLGDAGRWLSVKGRKLTRKVARWLAKSDKRRPAAIWTSPLVRAVQTAEIVAAEAGYKGEVRACAQLGTGHDPGDLLEILRHETGPGPIALIGHEPSLSRIAAALLGDLGFTGFKKSAVMGLTWVPVSEDVTPKPPVHDGGSTPKPPAELWFVLDPARMKSQKHIEPRPVAPSPTPVEDA
jgi:phosphohistidine phosphatase